MAIGASRITVDDTVGGTALVTGDAGVSGARVRVTNRDGANAVSLGPSGVTFAGGYELKAGESVDMVLPAGDELYGIAGATLSAVIHVLKTGE